MKKFLCLILCFNIFILSSFSSFASERSGGGYSRDNWNPTQTRNYIARHVNGIIANVIGVALGASPEDLLTELQRLIYIDEVTDNISYDDWFWNNVNFHFKNDNATPDNAIVDGFEVSQEFYNIAATLTQNFIDDHQLGYTVQKIFPITSLDATVFENQDYYNLVKQTARDSGCKFVAFRKIAGADKHVINGQSFYAGSYMLLLDNELEFDFYNPQLTSDYQFTSFNLLYKWGTPSFKVNSDDAPARFGFFHTLGQPNDFVLFAPNTTHNFSSFSFYNGSGSVNYALDRFQIYSTDIVRTVRVFNNIDAVKSFDSGQPAPYYFLNDSHDISNYSSYVDNSVGDTVYNDITDNIQTGLTADEIIAIIKAILENNNNGGGNNGGNNGSDNDWDFGDLFGSIGKLLKSLIEGIASVLSSIINGLSSLVESIIESVTNLIEWFTDENGSIFSFLKAFMDWLPEPIPKLILSLFTLSVLFSVIKLIKGVFS